MVYKPNQRQRNAVKIFLEYREILQNMLQTNNQNIKYVKHPWEAILRRQAGDSLVAQW